MSRQFFTQRRCVPTMRLATVISALALIGCSRSGDHPPVYPVKGMVTYKGKAITAGTVLYELEGGGEVKGSSGESGAGPLRIIGRIQPDGTFQLRAFSDAEGVPAGHYKVAIDSRKGRSEVGIFDPESKIQKGNANVLHARYADPKTSGLTDEVVKDRPNEPSFDLK